MSVIDVREIKPGIILLLISRPKALNAINREVMESLNSFFSKGHEKYSGLKGVIISGDGPKAFVAGADIKEFSDLNKESGSKHSQYGHGTYNLIERFHLPVIAAVNGFALGGGCELAMACHIRIAGENARFGQPEVNLGLVPGYGGTQRLIQLVGKGKAIELLLTADMINAEEAYRLGLVNHVVPSGHEVEAAEKMIAKIGKKGPIAVTKIIELVNKHFEHQSPAFDQECQDFGFTLSTNDSKEGALAFIEKRQANFKGN